MTGRPSRVCPRCGGVETVQVVSIEADGKTQLRCSGCHDRWDLSPSSPDAVPELVEIGDWLAKIAVRAAVADGEGADEVVVKLRRRRAAMCVRVFQLLDQDRLEVSA